MAESALRVAADCSELIVAMKRSQVEFVNFARTTGHKWVTPSVIYLRRAEYGVYRQALTRPELPKKATDRSRRSSQLAASVCHRQADLKYRRLLAAIGYRIVQIPVPTARAPLALVPAIARPKRNA
jgi:hypothetical protein